MFSIHKSIFSCPIEKLPVLRSSLQYCVLQNISILCNLFCMILLHGLLLNISWFAMMNLHSWPWNLEYFSEHWDAPEIFTMLQDKDDRVIQIHNTYDAKQGRTAVSVRLEFWWQLACLHVMKRLPYFFIVILGMFAIVKRSCDLFLHRS